VNSQAAATLFDPPLEAVFASWEAHKAEFIAHLGSVSTGTLGLRRTVRGLFAAAPHQASLRDAGQIPRQTVD